MPTKENVTRFIFQIIHAIREANLKAGYFMVYMSSTPKEVSQLLAPYTKLGDPQP